MKNLLVKIAATALISVGLVAQACAAEVKTYEDPYKMIEAVADQTFRRISNDQPVIQKDVEHLRVIVNEELVPYIDSRYAAFRVIGNYIKQTKPEERDAFVVAFKDYMVATYAGALTQYKNQKVIFEPAKAVGNQNIVTIKTRVIDPGKPDINIEFKLRRAKDAQNWQVFDMVAEGISLLDSKRAELGNLIRQQGLASVTALLVEKSKAPITAPLQGKDAKISQQQQTLLFAGALDRETVPTQWPFKLLKKLSGTVVFDFSELALVDTAGLAWLLHQVAQAAKLGLQIQMRHVPEQLISLAQLSDVLALLPLVEEDKGHAV